MIRRADYTWADANGTPEPGVYITVKTATGTLAILYNDAGASLSNPFQSGTLGAFAYNVANAGVYTEEYRLSLSDSPRKILEIDISLSGLDGLFVNAATLSIPVGTDMVTTVGADTLDHGAANYVAGTAPTARSGFTSANARNFVLSKEQTTVPQQFYDATDPDFQNAMQGALDYLYSLNINGTTYYRSSPKLIIPAGSAYALHAPLDIKHTLIIEGEGSGHIGATPASWLQWADGTSGFRVQTYQTSGDTTIDGAAHIAAGIFTMRDLKISGGYGATESNHHGIDAKAPIEVSSCWIDGWPGEGVNLLASIAGNSRNTSASSVSHSRISLCRKAIFAQGSDANVLTGFKLELLTNRQAGLWDDAGIGPNSYFGIHASGNGLDGKSQCSYSGKRYAVKVGQESGASTNAPSGTTADNTWWLHIEAGAVAAWAPAWVTGMTWRAGGDFITTDTPAVEIYSSYSEEGSFSQFGQNTQRVGGNIAARYYRGGILWPTGLFSYNFANDAAAAAFGIQIGQIYRNGSQLMIRAV